MGVYILVTAGIEPGGEKAEGVAESLEGERESEGAMHEGMKVKLRWKRRLI